MHKGGSKMARDFSLRTKRGYDFYEVASALQKAVRRGDAKLAGYFALELFASRYWLYAWKRLLTISAEDVAEPVTNEIYALFQGFLVVNDKKTDEVKGRIFLSKAVLILCKAMKSRDSDHMQCLMYDKKMGITDDEVNGYLAEVDEMTKQTVPYYTYDVHTVRGKILGKTREDFFKDEFNALSPVQEGLFDNLIKQL
jgi:replication-associated recombination protein RarA